MSLIGINPMTTRSVKVRCVSDNFLQFSITYVVGIHQNHLAKGILIKTHNRYFYGEIWEIIPGYQQIPTLSAVLYPISTALLTQLSSLAIFYFIAITIV